MTDDMFDLGEPADAKAGDADTDNTASSASTASTENTVDNDGTASTADIGDDVDNADDDPMRTPAYDAEYRTNQHTVAALDETWQEITDLLEDARAYSKLAGYSDVSRLEAYEAMFRLLVEEHEAEEVADAIQNARHRVHDDE